VYDALVAPAGPLAGALEVGGGADPVRVVADDRGAPDEVGSNIDGLGFYRSDRPLT